ncbi:hypothetical protein FJZ27_02865 [Candidatus Peribacteria bacterium]|nr:hypothetical protein [Candidatus Peribacteria bacterium]
MPKATDILCKQLPRLLQDGTERTLYKPLCVWLEQLATEEPLHLKGVEATAEESAIESEIGFPDITVRYGKEIAGWIEVKLPGKPLDHQSYAEQFLKYKSSLENVIFTNLQEWELWQWDRSDKEKPKRIKRVSFDLTKKEAEDLKELMEMLVHFFEYQPTLAKTPKQLALTLARKARFLSRQVEEALAAAIKEEDKEHELVRLRATFEKTLIADISDHQFANMVAETIAYSLFLACLEHDERGKDEPLTLTNAVDYLPKNVPILSDLFGLISRIAKKVPNAHHAAIALLEELNRADMHRIRQKLIEHKPGEDPVIQFYEPFLSEYDPAEREGRGVYYTPKPVVDFIVRGVDWLVKNKFGKEEGLADHSVNLLDPATGTGTFLMSAMQQIYWNVQKKNKALGKEMVKREFSKITKEHILKHFYGFELLIAPYAVAHLKLTLEAERLGFDFKTTENDTDPDNDRFKVYLANTLDDPKRPPEAFFGFDAIPQESEKAQTVKRDTPILAVIGNPPYSGISQNPVEVIVEYSKGNTYTNAKGQAAIATKDMKRKEKTWIGNLIEDYKYTEGDRITGKHFKEKKHWLGDDYVKFIRFSQWKIAQAGEGIVAMITNNGFLDNPTFRGMRYQLMEEFDEIYCLNLHGSTTKKDAAPGGGRDESIFNIQTGTCITFFVKKKKKQGCRVFYKDKYGLKSEKFSYLLETFFEALEWEELQPKKQYYFFTNKKFGGSGEYEEYWQVNNIFSVNTAGFVTGKDKITIDFDQEGIWNNISFMAEQNEHEIRSHFGLKSKDARDWTVPTAKKDVVKNLKKEFVRKCLYRPFDQRFTFYTGNSRGIFASPQIRVMKNFLSAANLGLVASKVNRQASLGYFFVSKEITDFHILDNAGDSSSSFPLYIYPETTQTNLLGEIERESNINPVFVKDFSDKLGMTPRPEEMFYYIYAIFHSPEYRKRYSAQLKIDFPRLPLTSNTKLFRVLVQHGNLLVNLHLLGENPFDSSKTIFDEPKEWNVKIGGKCPNGFEDWKVAEVRYEEKEGRVYVNAGQYFEGVEKEVWKFMIGGYQVCEKWLKDRKKAERILSTDDLKHYMKIVVSLRETIRFMQEIDAVIEEHGGWPMK